MAVKHKHLKLDQSKIDRARKYLGVKTEQETIEQALDRLIVEERIDRTVRRIKGKGGVEDIFAKS
jgi:hypothetical protein